jgi:hypothetical protein
MHHPAFAQWLQDVGAQPAEAQLAAVSKKLVELNPGFDGKLPSHRPKPSSIDAGVVTNILLHGSGFTDLSPLRS